MSTGEVPMSTGAERFDRSQESMRRRESLDEQARRRGLRPVDSVDDMACFDIFETDAELDAFLAHVYTERQANLA
jgi:hypothetical protein